MNHSKKIKDSDGKSLQEVIFAFFPYWPLFLLAIVIMLGAAYFYLRYTPKIYEATATIILKDNEKGTNDFLESLDRLNPNKVAENEIEMLQSETLMSNVVKKLHLYAPIYEYEKGRTTLAYVRSPVTIEYNNIESIREVQNVNLEYNSKANDVVINGKNRYKLNTWVETPYGTLRFTQNKRYSKPPDIKPLGFSLLKPEILTHSLLKNLDVAPTTKLSNIIKVKFRDENNKRAADIVNELLIAYTSASARDKNSLAANTLAFLDDRLSAVKYELDSIEKRIQQYKSGSGAVDIGMQGRLFLENVSVNDQKLSELDMQLAVLNQVEDQVRSNDRSKVISPSTLGVKDPNLAELLGKLYSSELEMAKLKKTVAENNPMVTSINDQINVIKPSILKNVQSQRNNLLASKGNLYATNNKYNSVLQSVPQKEKQLLERSRDQAIKSSIYSFLLQKREETALSAAATESNIRIVDKASSILEPVSPNSKLIYFASVVFAILMVIGLISIREGLNQKVLYRRDIESISSFPVIGEIPYQKSTGPIVVEVGNRSLIAEEFRKIRVTLPYLGIKAESKKILVTSSIPGEGKSFVAVNLAMTLAITGKKVVLVDMDLRNPSLSSMFTENNTQGIVELFLGRCELDEILVKSEWNENLHFIPTGTLTSNPSELLASTKVEQLFNYLQIAFDYVVIDTAPIIPVSDAYILSAYCDATLFIVRHNVTPKSLIKRIDGNMRFNPLTNPAIIFNSVRSRGYIKNNYAYGYGYVSRA